nr:DUF4046 domain-containing protein [Fredinandcohnia onubensis]
MLGEDIVYSVIERCSRKASEPTTTRSSTTSSLILLKYQTYHFLGLIFFYARMQTYVPVRVIIVLEVKEMSELNQYRLISYQELVNEPIVQIYEDVLSGKRSTLPKGTWESEKNVIIIYRYVLEVKLDLDSTKIPKIDRDFIKNHKLWGSLNRYKSIKKIIHLVYPNKYNEFDFQRVPIDYWNHKDYIRLRLEGKLAQEGYSIIDFPAVITYDQLIKWGFSNPLKRWGDSPFKLINALYPNMFTHNDFRSLPQGSSTNKKFLKNQFLAMLEKEKIEFENIPKKVTQNMLIKYRFSAPIKNHNGSPSKFIMFLFPGAFTLQEFNTPNGYWKKEQNIKATIDYLLQEKKIPHQDIPKIFTKKFFIENKLYGLLQEFHASPIELVMRLYPNEFDITEFQRVPNRYWYEKDNRINALRSFCKKRGIGRKDLPSLNRAYFHIKFPRFISMVDRHYDSKFYRWIIESFPEYQFEAKEFQLLLGNDGQLCDSKEEMTIHNYFLERLDNSCEIKREDITFYNNKYDEAYIPDWVICKGSRKFIVEYFGLYGSNRFPSYSLKVRRKQEYFESLLDFTFIPIMPEDFRNVGYVKIERLLLNAELL